MNRRTRVHPFTFAVAFAAASLSFASSAHAEDTWTDRFPGVRQLERITSDQKIHVLRVDLCAAGVSFRATKPSEKGQRPSEFAKAVGAQAAVNGDFFVSGFGLERGIAVGDGEAWPIKTPEDDTVGQLAFGDHRVELIRDKVLQSVQPWMKNVVGGRPTLLVEGEVQDFAQHPNLCLQNPRTAVGLSKGKKLLYVAVVDGREETNVGMTCTELANLMKDLGAENAMAFDGGGSSSMWIQDAGVVSHPSDGNERVVANHLAIFAKGQGDATACEEPPTSEVHGSCDRITGWVRGAAEPVELDVTFDVPPASQGATPTKVEAKTSTDCDDAGACALGFDVEVPQQFKTGGVYHQAYVTFRGRPADILGGGPATFSCASDAVDDAGTRPTPAPSATPPSTKGDRASASADGCDCHTAPSQGSGLVARLGLVAAFGLMVARLRRRSGR
jgi:hypothetical protein